jgi:hypothetical protein
MRASLLTAIVIVPREPHLLAEDCAKDESQLVDSYCNCAKGASLVGRRLCQGREPACWKLIVPRKRASLLAVVPRKPALLELIEPREPAFLELIEPRERVFFELIGPREPAC